MERTYTIPLRKEWLKSPRYLRAKKAVSAVRKFLQRHMKSEDVRLGKYLNLELWKHGMKNPPSRIRVNVSKDDKSVVRAEIVDAPVEKVSGQPKVKKAAKAAEEKVQDAVVKSETKEAPKAEKEAEKKTVKKAVKSAPAEKPQA